jgi:hypothetical protein
MKHSLLFFFTTCWLINEVGAQHVTVTAGNPQPLPPEYLGQNASNIIQYRGLTNPWLRQRMEQFRPGTIRHISSSMANWWDWRDGWLLEQHELPPGYRARDDWEVFGTKEDKIADLKHMTDTTGASVIYAPNLMTSRLDFQVAALFEFAYQNIPVRYMEMGSEFYLDNTEANLRFPTVLQYTDTAGHWIAGVKSLFPSLQISCIGATQQSNSSRRNTWTEYVVNEVEEMDALSTKVFLPCGFAIDEANIPKDKLPDLFGEPFTAMEPNQEVGFVLDQLPPGGEMWVSEYNLVDHRYIVNGLWAHGLFVAAQTFAFLSDERITRISEFRLSGDALHGNVFETSLGFADGPFYVSEDPTLPTDSNGLTAVGNVMTLLGPALQHGSSIQPLSFSAMNGAVVDTLEGGYSALAGYRVNKPFATDVIMANFSNDSLRLDLSSLFSNSEVVTTELLWYAGDTAKRPLTQVTGDMPVVNGELTGGEIYIPPYALLRCSQLMNQVYVRVTDDTICEGTTTTLIAYGGKKYTWSPPVVTSGDGAVAYVSPASTTTYTVTAIEGCTGAGCLGEATVQVDPQPQQGFISVAPSDSVCPGTPVTLTVMGTDADKFCWTAPGIGSQFNQSSITIIPQDTTTYYLFGAKAGCYSYRDSITIIIRPHADAGPDARLCVGDTFHLGTPEREGMSYLWTPATGLNDATLAEPFAVPLVVTDYIVQVTDLSTGCIHTDTVRAEPVQCCTAPEGTAVFPPHTKASDFLRIMRDEFGANVNTEQRKLTKYKDEIFINGDFIVDSSLTIQFCPKIRMGEKARFVVTNPNVRFSLNKDSITTCGDFRWSGIYVSNVVSKVVLDSVYLANADTGLIALRNADYEVTHSSFYNNQCGIFMGAFLESLEGALAQGTIYGTAFEGDYNSSVGISAQSSRLLQVGYPGEARNKFRQLHTAISVENGEAEIVRNDFKNVQYGILLNDTFPGAALYPEFVASVGGAFTEWNNSFDSVGVAVKATDVSVTIKNNEISHCRTGVWINNSTDRYIEVSKNKIEQAVKGINFNSNRDCHIVIKNNDITTVSMEDGVYPIGIQYTDISNDSLFYNKLRLTGNEITTAGYCGILLTNGNGRGYDAYVEVTPRVAENTVHLDYSPLKKRVSGLLFENCLNHVVHENVVEGPTLLNGRMEGLSFFGSSGHQVFCNTVYKAGSGLAFVGNNRMDSVWANDFSDTDSCIKVGRYEFMPGTLGDQAGNNFYSPGNRFLVASDQHLVQLTPPVINYTLATDEIFPPLNTLNFNLSSGVVPAFDCSETAQLFFGNEALPDPCGETSTYHQLLDSLSHLFPVKSNLIVDEHEALLWEIAGQCALPCGADVFIARAMLQTKYDELLFFDDELCNPYTSVENEPATGEKTLLVYPNPAYDFISLSPSTAYIKIHNSLGVLVLEKEIKSESRVDVSRLPAGLYLVKNETGLRGKFFKL